MTPYPPGISAGTAGAPWNEPHAHEHEFRPFEEPPVIEDGAAIFHQECIYAEGEYGQGYECEETRTYRFEYSTLESPDGKEWILPDITEWDQINDDNEVAEQVITIEEQFHAENADIVDIYPDRDDGRVTLEYDGWKLHFRA